MSRTPIAFTSGMISRFRNYLSDYDAGFWPMAYESRFVEVMYSCGSASIFTAEMTARGKIQIVECNEHPELVGVVRKSLAGLFDKVWDTRYPD